MPAITFSLIYDPIARAVLLVIGIGMITGTRVFVLIGRDSCLIGGGLRGT